MLLKHMLRINNDFARQQEMAMTNVSIEENVVIHTVAGRALTVDIFRPADTPGPVPFKCRLFSYATLGSGG
jgi:hypothetical protein